MTSWKAECPKQYSGGVVIELLLGWEGTCALG
jgi:hypothetical protein